MKFMNKFIFSGLCLILFNFPLTTMAQAEPCFTLEQGPNCGVAATGTTIKCDDGSSGPSFVRVAPATYKCKAAPRGSGGKKGCDNTGTEVNETLITYSCASGSYTSSGTTVLSTCHSAKLSGVACVGTADPEPVPGSAAELEAILDSFN